MANQEIVRKDFVKLSEYTSRMEWLQQKLEEEERLAAANKQKLEMSIAEVVEKIERKIEHTESRCKNEARKLVDFKLKSVSGKAKGSAQGKSDNKSGSRGTLSRAGPSDPQVRDGTASNSSLIPSKGKEAT